MEKTIERRTMLEEIKGTPEYIEKYFPIVKASSLSLDDEFLKHEPKTEKQRKFKRKLVAIIMQGIEDFRAQRIDPTFDEKGEICYQAGKKPAVGKEVYEWKLIALNFMREKNSRLGIKNQRIAFLGLIIKYLIKTEQYTVDDAWSAVCDQSKNIGHCSDSTDVPAELENTGSRPIGDWNDLSNTCKIIAYTEERGFALIGGSFLYSGAEYSLADVEKIDFPFGEFKDAVGWIVMDV